MNKITGFTRKPHILQMISYIIFFGNILIYSFIILPLSDLSEQIISAILFYSTSLLVVVSGFYTTFIDPTDDVVIEEKKCRAENKLFDNSKYEYFCNTCETHVNEDSKHCKQCERCVQKFDHHCKWVNNCIGFKNYGPFLVLIIGVMISSTTFSIFSIILTYQYTSSETSFILERAKFFENNEETIEGVMILLWVFTGLTILLAILDTNLVFFHFWLIKNELTTYEYILRRREKSGKKIDRKKFLKKIDKHKKISTQNENEIGQRTNSPNINPIASNLPAISGTNLNLESLTSNKTVDWRGKIFNFFKKPVKKNKVFTETSRNTELIQNDIHNDEDNFLPKISDFLIEKAGCNAEVEINEEENKSVNNEEMISSGLDTAHKNALKGTITDEKFIFLTPTPNERNELHMTKEHSKETSEPIPNIQDGNFNDFKTN